MDRDDLDDDFDLGTWGGTMAPSGASSAGTSSSPPPPAPEKGKNLPVLKANQVAAVRFHTAKPGYSFDQVETFVDQVEHTLTVAERAMYEKDLALHEAREEQADLQDRIQTLMATIEVFRAKGDPMVRSDGSYMTESAMSGGDPQMVAQLQSQVQSLTDQNSQLQAYGQQMQALVAQLQADLATVTAERDEADQAERELRDYVENTLTAWMSQQAAAPAPAATDTAPPLVSQPSTTTNEPAEPAPLVDDFEPMEIVDPYTGVTEVDDPGALLGGDDWAGAPFIGSHQETVVAPAPAHAHAPATQSPESAAEPPIAEQGGAPRLAILTTAPELASVDIDPASLPEDGHPSMELPPLPERRRAPLTDAPELSNGPELLADEEG